MEKKERKKEQMHIPHDISAISLPRNCPLHFVCVCVCVCVLSFLSRFGIVMASRGIFTWPLPPGLSLPGLHHRNKAVAQEEKLQKEKIKN